MKTIELTKEGIKRRNELYHWLNSQNLLKEFITNMKNSKHEYFNEENFIKACNDKEILTKYLIYTAFLLNTEWTHIADNFIYYYNEHI